MAHAPAWCLDPGASLPLCQAASQSPLPFAPTRYTSTRKPSLRKPWPEVQIAVPHLQAVWPRPPPCPLRHMCPLSPGTSLEVLPTLAASRGSRHTYSPGQPSGAQPTLEDPVPQGLLPWSPGLTPPPTQSLGSLLPQPNLAPSSSNLQNCPQGTGIVFILYFRKGS